MEEATKRFVGSITLLMFLLKPAMSQDCGHVLMNTCFQVCNSTTCTCNDRSSRDVFATCEQRCDNEKHAPCRKLLCSSSSCVQRCHGCNMECTRDVKFCSQLCLSGNCGFKCAGERCQTQCQNGACVHMATDNVDPLPKYYLALLAGLFGACAVLSAIALVISCYGYYCVSRNAYRRFRSRLARRVPEGIKKLPLPA